MHVAWRRHDACRAFREEEVRLQARDEFRAVFFDWEAPRVRVGIGEQGQVAGGGAQRPCMRAAITQSSCCGAPHVLVA